MISNVLLDTNIVIAFFANDPAVLMPLQKVRFFVPSIVLGELYAGARRSGRPNINLARIDAMIPRDVVLSCDAETAQAYGVIKHGLLAKGRPIPENDIWIAAVAQQYRLTLITRDAHFSAIDSLSIESW